MNYYFHTVVPSRNQRSFALLILNTHKKVFNNSFTDLICAFYENIFTYIGCPTATQFIIIFLIEYPVHYYSFGFGTKN